MTTAKASTHLPASARPPVEAHDGLLVDLDGVVYVGEHAVPGAPDVLAAARRAGVPVAFVTNNASRTPGQVADHLLRLGLHAAPDEVVTSAQAAARLVAASVTPGAPVLVVGGEGLFDAVREQGLRVVESADESPVAVVQGYGPQVGWRHLAEAALAVGRGARWVASNTDPYLPSPRGRVPGNGALVGVVQAVTGREPEVAGKPHPPLFREAVRRTGSRRPLVVGDRLDTDIRGACEVGLASMLVLTGATALADLLATPRDSRPTYVAADLGGLLAPHPPVLAGERGGWCCVDWCARIADGRAELRGTGRHDDPGAGLLALRALTAAVWAAADAGHVRPGDLDLPAAAGRITGHR